MRLTRLLAIAVTTVLAVPPLQAATPAVSKATAGVESSVMLTAGKKKKAKSTKAKKATKVAAFKSCGTFMYRKDGKCLDARTKK
jgi:hypothetical protein